VDPRPSGSPKKKGEERRVLTPSLAILERKKEKSQLWSRKGKKGKYFPYKQKEKGVYRLLPGSAGRGKRKGKKTPGLMKGRKRHDAAMSAGPKLMP